LQGPAAENLKRIEYAPSLSFCYVERSREISNSWPTALHTINAQRFLDLAPLEIT
jgi:hypothetical protein